MTTPFAVSADLTPTNDDLVDYASALIRLSCEWHIFPEVSATENVDIIGGDRHLGFAPKTSGPRKLYLRTLQLVSVESATLPDGTQLTADQLTSDPVGWVRRADGMGWPSCGTVQFAYTHGYDAVTSEIKAVTVSIAKRMPASFSVWTHRKMGTAVVQMAPTISIPPGSFTVAEELVLERYRIPVTRA